MKKLFSIIIISVGIVTTASAQSVSYHAVKVDMSVGSDPVSSINSVTFTLEPHYRITDEIAVGLRFQDDASGGFNFQSGSSHTDTKVYSSTCASADYYFLKGKTQGSLLLFGGGGVGIFSEFYTHNNVDNQNNNLGLFPRIGLETGHFRASAEYNITGGSISYLSFNVGFFFGGGKK